MVLAVMGVVAVLAVFSVGSDSLPTFDGNAVPSIPSLGALPTIPSFPSVPDAGFQPSVDAGFGVTTTTVAVATPPTVPGTTAGTVASQPGAPPGPAGTTVSPRTVTRGSNITASASGASPGRPYQLRIAEFGDACASGTAIGTPVQSDTRGEIAQTTGAVPFALAAGPAVVCFVAASDPGTATPPATLTVS